MSSKLVDSGATSAGVVTSGVESTLSESKASVPRLNSPPEIPASCRVIPVSTVDPAKSIPSSNKVKSPLIVDSGAVRSGMLVDSSRKKRIKGENYEGMIITTFKRGEIGALEGFLFDLSIDTEEEGSLSMEFILTRPVSEYELKNMLRISRPEDVSWEEARRLLEEFLRQEECYLQ